MQTQASHFLSLRLVRLAIVAVAIGSCFWIIWTVADFGLARLFVNYSLRAANLPVAEKAVKLAPSDAESHLARAAVLSLSTSANGAAAELEKAVALRPADYYLWLQLGLLRDRAEDSPSALSAFNESVRLAPFYAEPRWQRGNLLLRMGRYNEAFADLTQAARSNPELVPTLIDLAWGLSKGSADLTAQLAQIKADGQRIAFAKFLVRQGKAQEALRQFRSAGSVKDEVRLELVQRLVEKGAFREAFEIWRGPRGAETVNEPVKASIHDGGFESPLSFDEVGFGWRVPRGLAAVTMSLDSSQPHSGSRSLRIEFGGESDPASSLVSQLVLVEPSSRYKINFASRSQDVVTGGLPIVVVNDASGDRKRLGQSAPLSNGTSDWQVRSFEFVTPATTNAVVINLLRESCTTSPCPIFGSISLDSFSAEKLK
jgi:tetratricopeptide (TPR) repeat protein